MGDAVEGEVGKVGGLTVLTLRGVVPTSEQAGGRIKSVMGGVIEGSGSNSHLLGNSTRAQEYSGVEKVGEVSISCVFVDSHLAWSAAILYWK